MLMKIRKLCFQLFLDRQRLGVYFHLAYQFNLIRTQSGTEVKLASCKIGRYEVKLVQTSIKQISEVDLWV